MNLKYSSKPTVDCINTIDKAASSIGHSFSKETVIACDDHAKESNIRFILKRHEDRKDTIERYILRLGATHRLLQWLPQQVS